MAEGELVEDLAVSLDLPAEVAVAPHDPQLGRWPADPPAIEAAALAGMEATDDGRRGCRVDLTGSGWRELEADKLAGRGALVRALAEARDQPGREDDRGTENQDAAADDGEPDEEVENRSEQAVRHGVVSFTAPVAGQAADRSAPPRRGSRSAGGDRSCCP